MNKRHIILLIAFLVTASLSFVSCGDDDESDPVADMMFVTAITSDQLSYFDETFAINYNGQARKIKLSDMKDVTSDATYSPTLTRAKALFRTTSKLPTLKLFLFNCGYITYGTEVKVFPSATVKANHPDGKTFDAIICNSIYTKVLSDSTTNCRTMATSEHLWSSIMSDNKTILNNIAQYFEDYTSSLTIK